MTHAHSVLYMKFFNKAQMYENREYHVGPSICRASLRTKEDSRGCRRGAARYSGGDVQCQGTIAVRVLRVGLYYAMTSSL